MKEKHGHVVSFYEADYDGGAWLRSASDIERTSFWHDDGKRFAFCSECGASLAAFWQEIDAARESHRQQMEREEQSERQERERERVYSKTPPT